MATRRKRIALQYKNKKFYWKKCKWCKRWFVTFYIKKVYCCKTHAKQAHLRCVRSYQKQLQELDKEYKPKKWKCICPRCGGIHTRIMLYTGNEKVPRYMCEKCKLDPDYCLSEEPIHQIGYPVSVYR